MIVEELKSQNMNQEELRALKFCYEAAYQDSMGSMQMIVALFLSFAGIDIVSDLVILTEIRFIAKFVLFLLWLLYSCKKIKELSKESASLRNHIMAVSILLIKINRYIGMNIFSLIHKTRSVSEQTAQKHSFILCKIT